MKYCVECGSEYEDSVTQCADDGSTELVSLEEMHRRGLLTAEERDTRRFVRAGTAEDPLSAETITRVLQEQSIPVFARPRRSGTVDVITSGVASPWWEILVPEEHLERATALVADATSRIEREAAENAAAVDAETSGAGGEKL